MELAVLSADGMGQEDNHAGLILTTFFLSLNSGLSRAQACSLSNTIPSSSSPPLGATPTVAPLKTTVLSPKYVCGLPIHFFFNQMFVEMSAHIFACCCLKRNKIHDTPLRKSTTFGDRKIARCGLNWIAMRSSKKEKETKKNEKAKKGDRLI